MEVVGGILAFVYYPKAKEVALKSMAKYNENSEEGRTIKAAWDELQKSVN